MADLNLSDFSTNETPTTVADLAPDPDRVAPVNPVASNRNLAAMTVATSSRPEDVERDYEQINNETTIEGQSVRAKELQQNAVQNHMDINKKSLLDIMADPNVPIEVKNKAVSQVYDQDSALYSSDKLLAVSALSKPVQGENVEEEQHRVNAGQFIDQLNGVKAAQQELLNSHLIQANPDTSSKVSDFLANLIPFSNQKKTAEVLSQYTGNPVGSYFKAFLAPGEAKEDLRQMLRDTPADQRVEKTQQLLDIINSHSGIVASTQNDFSKIQMAQEFIATNGYDPEKKWEDNISGLIDLTGLASLAGKAARGINTASNYTREVNAANALRDSYAASQAYRSAGMDLVKGTAQPMSVSSIYKDTNADSWRQAYEQATRASGDGVAEATHGVNKADAAMADAATEIAHPDGTVKAKPSAPDGPTQVENAPNQDLVEFYNGDGATQYFQREKAAIRSKVVTDFQQAFGMGDRSNMFQVQNVDHTNLDNGVKISAVYGPPVSGYSNPNDALELTKWAFRQYGLDESNVSLLARAGGDYVPLTGTDLQAHQAYAEAQLALDQGKSLSTDQVKLLSGPRPSGDYLVKVDYNYKFSAADAADSWVDATTSRWNALDAYTTATGRKGTVTSTLLDPASLLDPVITKSNVVAFDKAAGGEHKFLEMTEKVATPLRKLPVERRELMTKLWNEQNEKSISLKDHQLRLSGMTDDEIKIHKDFRNFWDTAFHFENKDRIQWLKNRGYQEFYHPEGDSKLFARPLGRTSLSGNTKVYDPVTGSISYLSPTDATKLYDKGGTVASLQDSFMEGNEHIEHIIVSNTPGNGYLRALNENTTALHYRPGYYRVAYRDPFFIEKVVKDANGKELFRRAVATAPDSNKAALLQRRFQTSSGEEHVYRRAKELSGDRSETADWQLGTGSGRGAQRVRGKRLEDGTWYTQNVDQMNVQNPIEAMVNTSRSLSRRIATRNSIEVAKARALSQYSDVMPKDKYGQPTYPSNIQDIKYYGKGNEDAASRAMIADARTLAQYTNMLEHGLINSLDDSVKALLHGVADKMGGLGQNGLERAIRPKSTGKTATGVVKSLAYHMYIATNPLRQFIVQSHQAVLLNAINPTWCLSGRGFGEISYMISRHVAGPNRLPSGMMDFFKFSTGSSADELETMYKQFLNTGQIAAIDRHSLVKDAALDMADTLLSTTYDGALGKARKVATYGLNALRKVGFDSGEFINTTSSYLAFRDLAKKAGRDLSSAEVQDDIAAQARNFTGNMNQAGDLSYQSNDLNLIMQFQQNAHKLALNMTTNRILSTKDKLKFFATTMLLSGMGTGWAYSKYFAKYMPQDDRARDAVAQGIEGMGFNYALSVALGKDTYMDWSSLSPTNMYGTMDLIHGIMTTNVGEILSSMPSTQLVFGNNPRLTNLAQTAARFIHQDEKDIADPTTFGDLMLQTGKLSSGFSNAYKAALVMQLHQKFSSSGKVADSDVNPYLAPLIAAGFPTLDESLRYKTNDILYQASQDKKDDIKKAYQNCKQNIKGALTLGTQDPAEFQQSLESIQRVSACTFAQIGVDDFTYFELDRLMKQDVSNGDATLHQAVLRANNIVDNQTQRALINMLPNATPEEKQNAQTIIDYFEKAHDQLQETNRQMDKQNRKKD